MSVAQAHGNGFGYSPDYDGDCRECPFGHYTDAAGQTTCTQCPASQTTIGSGSTSSGDCVTETVACDGITCSDNGDCTVSSAGQRFCNCIPGNGLELSSANFL